MPLGRHGWARAAPLQRGERHPTPTDPGTSGNRGATRTLARIANGTGTGTGTRTGIPTPDRGNLTVGAAKAGALLDRQLTLARTRAHSTALQALGSSRFHAVADKVAVLASEVPLAPAATTTDLRPSRTPPAPASPTPWPRSPPHRGQPVQRRGPDPRPVPGPRAPPPGRPWHQVRLLLRLHRYALEVCQDAAPAKGLLAAGEALDRHRDASEAAAAAAQAARTPRITPATAYALGVLHADQRHEVEAARYAFQRSWQTEALGAS
ncbi:hypothetical protein SHKM778_91190 [Streptomyces sp. KM77-8]|uniref:CHAD domain-containing protein n=1 Tax=Streptomyces haneummycinicus TaxID=3074435 RepID=A0AAT9HZ62_9ACTN